MLNGFKVLIMGLVFLLQGDRRMDDPVCDFPTGGPWRTPGAMLPQACAITS
jgi:hypothetical protein